MDRVFAVDPVVVQADGMDRAFAVDPVSERDEATGMVEIYDRKTRQIYREEQYGQKKLQFLYHTVPGRFLLKTMISNKLYSRVNAWFENRPGSVRKIGPFVKKYRIATEDFEEREYASFADFFTRKIKAGAREIARDPAKLIAPADAKLLVYPIEKDRLIKIKQSVYTVEELLRDRKISDEFAGGLCLVYRLSVDDYHRYCYIDNGVNVRRKAIPGRLHTVSSLSDAYKVFQENQREYNLQATEHLGKIIYMEVGALQVGKIHNHPAMSFSKGQEKGYFAYGGSTIILLLQKGKVQMDADILEMTAKGIETKVRYGEAVGEILAGSQV